MKTLILFILTLSLSAHSSNWMPESKILAKSSQAYQLKKDCEAFSGELCLDVGLEPELVSLGFVAVKESFSKTEIEKCESEEDCQIKHESKKCERGESIKNLDLKEVYCSESLGKELAVDRVGYEAFREQKRTEDLAAENKRKELRETDFSKITTIAQLKAIVERLVKEK